MSGFGLWLYKRLRKLSNFEAKQIIKSDLEEFERTKLIPVINRIEGRLTNVEKLEQSLGAIRSDLGHLKTTVEKNAQESSAELTGAMNRLSDQRKEDREIQLERIDSLKELIEAKLK